MFYNARGTEADYRKAIEFYQCRRFNSTRGMPWPTQNSRPSG